MRNLNLIENINILEYGDVSFDNCTYKKGKEQLKEMSC